MLSRVVPLILSAMFLLSPFVSAGSADDPEITDGSGDALADILDITNAWVTPLEGNNEIELTIELTMAPPVPGAPTQTGPNARYAFDFVPFSPSGTSLVPLNDPASYTTSYVQAAPQSVGDLAGTTTPSDWSFDYGHVYYDGQFNQLVSSASISGRVEGNLITFVLPLGASQEYVKIPTGVGAGGYSLRNLMASSSSWVTVAGIGAGGDDDHAPDDGFGREFYFEVQTTPASSGPEPIYADLDTASVAHSWVDSTSGTYVFNWTAESSELDAGYTIAVTEGTAQLIVTDPAGIEQINQTFSADDEQSFSWTDLPTGQWTIQIAYANFTGDLSFSMAEPEPEQPDETSTGTSSSTGTSTGSSTSTSTQTSSTTTQTQAPAKKKSPGFDLVPILGLVGAALVVARRRL